MTAASNSLDWGRDGRDWPNREHSRFIRASAIRWHVQRMGNGPVILALHGTGAATHSWRDLMPCLAEHFDVFAVDLPGHGFTQRPAESRLTLPGMATAIAELVDAEGLQPTVVVGHSAGAAILCRMVLDRRVSPSLIVGLNAALLPFSGLLGSVYRWGAQVTKAIGPWAARRVARQAEDMQTIASLVERTGSSLDPQGLRLYQKLVRHRGHTEAAMAMMAGWDLRSLESDLAQLPCELLLIAGGRDSAVPPTQALHLAAKVDRVRTRIMPDVGHLSHEERPSETAAIILDAARQAGVVSSTP